MKLKCRICGAEVLAPHKMIDILSEFTGNEPREHLQQHRWQILRLIQGTEGDGTFARFLESMLFEAQSAPGESDLIDHERSLIQLLQGARNPDAVNPDLKGAPRPHRKEVESD